MKVKVRISGLKGKVSVPFSKSDIHRKLIAGAIDGSSTYHSLKEQIDAFSWSDDVKATSECIEEIFFSETETAIANARESGSTLRFLLPVAAALGRNTDFILSEGLKRRPVEGLVSVLNQHGGGITLDDGIIRVRGRLLPGEYLIDATVSSQYVSGLYFAQRILGNGLVIREIGSRVSGPYVEMTKKVFSGPLDRFEGDWSAGAYYYGLNFIGCDIEVRGLSMDSLQGDKAIEGILDGLGHGDVDITDIPDLAPVIAMCACALPKGESVRMTGASRLSLKETDRGMHIAEIINDLGGEAYFEGDVLSVFGKGRLPGGECSGGNDHRMIMMAACLSMICENEVVINEASGVSKSYPRFFEDLSSLGGNIEYINEE